MHITLPSSAPFVVSDPTLPPGWALPAAALVEAALLASVVRKTTRATSSVGLRDALGVPPALWSAIGVLEACGALGLVVGLVRPPVGTAAAVGTALLMAGAILAHRRVGLSGRGLLAPAVLFSSSAVAAAGYSAAR